MNGQRPPIREWPPEDRPRERFLTKGAEALSDAECLALLLGSGVPGQSALDQAQALLAAFGSIAAVADREVQELAWVGGLGIAKAVRLGAAIELSRRLRARPNGGRVRLSSPEEVAGYFGPGLEGKKKEVFDGPVRRHRRIRGDGGRSRQIAPRHATSPQPPRASRGTPRRENRDRADDARQSQPDESGARVDAALARQRPRPSVRVSPHSPEPTSRLVTYVRRQTPGCARSAAAR